MLLNMRIITKLHFYFAIVLLLTACNKKESTINRIDEQFKDCLKSVTGTNKISTKIYMVIPRAGCSGCISTAEDFLLTSLKDTSKADISFILTDYDSEKSLKARFGALLQNKHIIRDPNNVFKANKSLKSIYPTIFMYGADSRLVAVTEVSPTKNGLAELNMFLSASKN